MLPEAVELIGNCLFMSKLRFTTQAASGISPRAAIRLRRVIEAPFKASDPLIGTRATKSLPSCDGLSQVKARKALLDLHTPARRLCALPRGVHPSALPFRQRPAVFGNGDPLCLRLAARWPFLAAQRAQQREVDDLRMWGKAHRPGVVQLQPTLLFDRTGLRDLRGGDRLH